MPGIAGMDDTGLDLEWAFASRPGSYGDNGDYGHGRAFEDYVCLVLCDGLGGHSGGAQAAKHLTAALLERLPSKTSRSPLQVQKLLAAEIDAAAREMRAQVLRENADLDPHTTCVVAWITSSFVVSAHVGDSRLYLIRGGRIVWRTQDHSMARLLNESPSEGAAAEDARRLYRSLNGRDTAKVTLGVLPPLGKSDAVVLCTDGLWAAVEDQAMVRGVDQPDLRQALIDLVAAAHAAARSGGHDDASILAARRARRG
ncbi:MAG TPA: PP2C family serine/threonine-protein phosphatase [Gammaproteobacteria bacterium]